MILNISSITFSGLEITDVNIEVQITEEMPSFTILGLDDKIIEESRERLKDALFSIGLSMPAKKILVNLSPAELLTEGRDFDLPIAVAILSSMSILPEDELREYIVIGELSLDGRILPVSGVLPAAIEASARSKGIICPSANSKEAAWSGNDKILAPDNLLALVNHFKGKQALLQPKTEFDANVKYADMQDIIGQDYVKRALEIAAAGGHNILMFGPHDSGKSMLAQYMTGILPPMNVEEILECSTIASIAGLISNGKLIRERPFRAPDHSYSIAAIFGGGDKKRGKPGEISLAHNGILFLDELPEFEPSIIESLIQSTKTDNILISRDNSHIQYRANFQIIAAMNLCKCGYLNDESKSCNQAPKCGSDYQMSISRSIWDHFDIKVEVRDMDVDINITKNAKAKESSKEIAERVFKARELQRERYLGYGISSNSRLDGQLLTDYATPSEDGQKLLNEAAKKFKLSMACYNRVLRVARTIADLENANNINKIHIAESLSYSKINYLNMPAS